MQRLGEHGLRAGPEGAFTMASVPNMAFSVPLARLRTAQQRSERAHAAAARAAASGAGLIARVLASMAHPPTHDGAHVGAEAERVL